jgi:hypothetical protein
MNCRSVFCTLAAASLVAACSPPAPPADAGADSSAQPDASALPDATMEASSLPDASDDGSAPSDVVATDTPAADAGDAGDAGMNSCALNRVIVTTSDGSEGAYVTGSVATRALSYLAPPMGASVEQDHVVRRAGCRVYDLNRSFGAGPNQLLELDPANPWAPRRTITIPPIPMVGAPNPYDVVEVSASKSYLALYNGASLYVFNPQTGAMSGSISLASFAGADAIPEAAMLHVANGRAWVALQQLDRTMGYAPPARSTVVAIDTATDTLADLDAMTAGVQSSISLSFGNPQSSTATADGRYWVIASTGTFGSATDGGLSVIDTQTGAEVRSVSAAMLGGDPGAVTMVDATTAWVVTRPSADGGAQTVVRAVNIMTGAVAAMPVHQRAEPLGAIERGPDGNIWAINGSFGANGAVYFIAPNGAELGRFVLPSRGDAGTTGTYSIAFAP